MYLLTLIVHYHEYLLLRTIIYIINMEGKPSSIIVRVCSYPAILRQPIRLSAKSHVQTFYSRHEMVMSWQAANDCLLLLLQMMMLVILLPLLPLPVHRVGVSTAIHLVDRQPAVGGEVVLVADAGRRIDAVVLLLLRRRRQVSPYARRRDGHRYRTDADVVVSRRWRRDDSGAGRVSVRPVDLVDVGVFVVDRAAAARIVERRFCRARHVVRRLGRRRRVRVETAGGVIRRTGVVLGRRAPAVRFRHRFGVVFR